MAEYGKPYQSCLIPYEKEIIDLRRKKPPMPFSRIAEYLNEKYQISVRRQTIKKFLKVRAKGFKPCKYAWSIEPETAENLSATKVTPVLAKSLAATSAQEKSQKQPAKEKPTTSEASGWKSEPFKMKYSETYNLPRLSPEEAEVRNKIIEQKMWEKYHKNRQSKTKQ